MESMHKISPIIREILVDYITKIVTENGLGSMEEYNIVMESSTDDLVKISVFIDEINEALNIPIYTYAESIGKVKFQSDMNDYISDKTKFFLKIDTNTTINITKFILLISVHSVDDIIPGHIVEQTISERSEFKPFELKYSVIKP